MRIIDVHTTRDHAIPLTLGEAGRGRRLENVALHTQQPPTSADDVGYVSFGTPEIPRAILRSATITGQLGVLLVIRTRGGYTRGSNTGLVALRAGDAHRVAAGRWADGDAGGLGGGPDELWHAAGPALFTVVLSGGQPKGFGRRWIVVGPTFDVSPLMHDDALTSRIVAGDDVAAGLAARYVAQHPEPKPGGAAATLAAAIAATAS